MLKAKRSRPGVGAAFVFFWGQSGPVPGEVDDLIDATGIVLCHE